MENLKDLTTVKSVIINERMNQVDWSQRFFQLFKDMTHASIPDGEDSVKGLLHFHMNGVAYELECHTEKETGATLFTLNHSYV